MRKRFVEASALLMRSDGTCLLSPFFTTTFTSFFVSFLAEATWKGISYQFCNVNESWILCHFVCTLLTFMSNWSKLQRQLMQFHQSAKDWKYLFLLLFFRRRFWPWRDQNPMVIPLSNLEYDVDEKENASEKCVHEMSKVSLLIFDLSKMSKDAKMFKFQLSKRWQSCHFPNIKRCQGVNLLQSPTNLFYLKALVSFGGNPNLVHEKSSIFLEFILIILFPRCPKMTFHSGPQRKTPLSSSRSEITVSWNKIIHFGMNVCVMWYILDVCFFLGQWTLTVIAASFCLC